MQSNASKTKDRLGRRLRRLRPALVSIVAAAALGLGIANAQSVLDGNYSGTAGAGYTILIGVKDGQITAYDVPGFGSAKNLSGRIETDETARADHVSIRTIKIEPDGRAFTIRYDTGQSRGRVDMKIVE